MAVEILESLRPEAKPEPDGAHRTIPEASMPGVYGSGGFI
jgi:hypothetical protein